MRTITKNEIDQTLRFIEELYLLTKIDSKFKIKTLRDEFKVNSAITIGLVRSGVIKKIGHAKGAKFEFLIDTFEPRHARRAIEEARIHVVELSAAKKSKEEAVKETPLVDEEKREEQYEQPEVTYSQPLESLPAKVLWKKVKKVKRGLFRRLETTLYYYK